ncbi:2-C-methyl-D-erythritol 4-phosphate cytidylyltransferase [Glaciimonas sp. CA11.2]|uniref:2-C-methyl-D-erythritol 4-phosphate cytidylyltransferase n=1 Tax=unclassified Glaciimonas TaxID=2644401 RepID=UPI002AB34DDF|nr:MULTISPECIES: 2-C-methyl-D-erythritol 4-phosphate cytidylyltransferase [unclassified Glaciimonas]MDY7547945.1 2-C-methyl-D-erythritol 4-phosphate cytidylyltransferase [Glaciimonas sp. CA11.2]MEB0010117.1 2-C-methyl-D-erythritol 4-phosphate cytidylyltransferase [Glaciimonas sp. Cout2]MEB0081768.1 2-C-methyl-D-erythritol 4-phosphate cytidylyltransferase [Glaciimonas sp. Gout2]MEB0164856.1 2-C-methyl-D-erythritol 4-phosphate cytidylyltransferase [Glaciimonas sp. CA11.2]
MHSSRNFALIPAAGIGARLGADYPKQYLPLAGKAMLRHVLDTFVACAAITHTFVVVSAEDGYIADLMAAAPHLQERVTLLYYGGESRHLSVLNGLNVMGDDVADDDWVLVHDAARPGLTVTLIDQLIAALRDDDVGGLLALPVVDTLKRSDEGRHVGAEDRELLTTRVTETVSRTGLWAAQTPQMFRYSLLHRALDNAFKKGLHITDDASAIEMLGLQPKLVKGSPRNFKVTLPHDIALAEIFLREKI